MLLQEEQAWLHQTALALTATGWQVVRKLAERPLHGRPLMVRIWKEPMVTILGDITIVGDGESSVYLSPRQARLLLREKQKQEEVT